MNTELLNRLKETLHPDLYNEVYKEFSKIESPKDNWIPQCGDYFIDCDGIIVEKDDCVNEDYLDFGVVRRFYINAEYDSDEMRKYNRLLAYRAEFDPNYYKIMDGQYAYYLNQKGGVYSYIEEVFNDTHTYLPTNVILFSSSSIICELVNKLNDGVVVL